MTDIPYRHGSGSFPQTRLRRMRLYPWVRAWNHEHELTAKHLILPIFVHDQAQDEPIALMPHIQRLSFTSLLKMAERARKHGISALMLFPFVPADKKDAQGSEALNPDNTICRAIQLLRQKNIDIGIICDVALDPYTSHGHDGIIKDGTVDNDATIAVLAKQACLQAQAGCSMIAPSDMMDGRVATIRRALDAKGFEHVSILSYSAKYQSQFYTPFRQAIGSQNALKSATKITYQMNPANKREALREALQDIEEGADMLMVKPSTIYLDILHMLREHTLIPLATYHVSGEYAMLRAGAQAGCFPYEAALLGNTYQFPPRGCRCADHLWCSRCRRFAEMNDQPLKGITVIDMTRVLAGPYCTMLLQQLGARIIKVEKPPHGDDARHIGPFVNGKSMYFAALNRGKESIALSLKDPEHRNIFDDLLCYADVLVENARPDTLAQHGYSWHTVHQRWPKLHYATISGFGYTGPYRHRPSYDLIAQAMGGIMQMNREPHHQPDSSRCVHRRSRCGSVRNHRYRRRPQRHDRRQAYRYIDARLPSRPARKCYRTL